MGDDEYPSDLSRPEEIEIVLSWEDACNLWLKDAGSTWPGGTENLLRMHAKVIELGLEDASDKQAALMICFDELIAENALVNPEDDDDPEPDED